jgi:soluble lytic murein transglycosylase-like protein
VRRLTRAFFPAGWTLVALLSGPAALAGNQMYEPLSASVQAALNRSISDQATPFLAFTTEDEARRWLSAMSHRLAKRMPDRVQREEFLVTVHYEAKRAGLDPQMVLGLIQVESNFRKYAVSRAGARGYMQVMPFWVKLIGARDDNLFHLRTNLRYGCVILRHYLDIERGNLFRALGRYNGSLGKAEYPNMVERAWQRDWSYSTRTAQPAPRGDHPSRSTFAGVR